MRFFSIAALTVTLFLAGAKADSFASGNPGFPSKQSVKKVLQEVADWQIANFKYSKAGSAAYLHDYGIDAWTNATLYIGMTKWAEIADKGKYSDWLYRIGEENEWAMPSNFVQYPKYGLYHADELCIGQFYLNMYDIYKEDKIIEAVKARADYIINNPPDTAMSYKNKQSWTWSDALFMAPAVYLHLSILTNEDKYAGFMHSQFKNTCDYLYDGDEKLFFRDGSYFDKEELNGEKVFWGRGNGWVIAGLANILKLLPENSPEKTYYERFFVNLAGRLTGLQDKDGFWHASLLNPAAYPSPETSATALISYALAYGINTGLLDKAVYGPATAKAWQALTSAVDKEGKLGWVQPIGADPKKTTGDMTAVYGVGAFLLAGTEIYKLAG